MMMVSKKQQQRLSTTWDASNFPYPVDYNDHFETPEEAYWDLKPVLDLLTSSSTTTSPNHFGIIGKNLYDPYYCNGQARHLLEKIGYENVIHEKRDFYADISNHTIPKYDILITNPPYSDEHKKRCIEYCCHHQQQQHKQPYFLLMPAYVATKQYLREALSDMFFLVPSKDYQYHHPENTGKEVSPFTSLWFCGVGASRIDACIKLLSPHKLRIAKSLFELAEMKVIRLQNRINPRQRRRQQKRKKQQQPQQQQLIETATTETAVVVPMSGIPTSNEVIRHPDASQQTSNNSKKTLLCAVPTKAVVDRKSKYRDLAGQRKRRRF